MPLTQAERTLQARLAAHAQHSQGKTNTAPARVAFLERLEREADPKASSTPRSGQASRSTPSGRASSR